MSRMDVNQSIAFYGTIIHSVDVKKPVVILENTVVAIKERKIVALQTGVEKKEAHQLISNLNIPIENFQILRTGEFIIPGLIDTHIHAPQYVNMGIGYDLTLLGWLDKYTFPTEAKFHDLDFASKVYSQVVKRTLQNGTTTASYFATIHLDASLLLAKIMNSYGQRGYVGKVCMDMNSPDNYVETTKDSLSSTRQFIESMRKEYRVAGIVAPCVTPRFAASCSKELMIGLAQLAKEFNAPIQTHISENEGEISWVKDIFKVPEYVDVYEQAGLMTEKTILAHCVFSNDKELDVMKKYGAGIAHCPNSNTSLTSGQMNSRKVLSKGVKLGLGKIVFHIYFNMSTPMVFSYALVSYQLCTQNRHYTYRVIDCF